jgi:hypothetical protein
MIYYYVNIFWKDEWSPVYITTDKEEAETLLEQLKKSWSKNAADYNVDIDYGIRLEEKKITDSLIYDCDWFNE